MGIANLPYGRVLRGHTIPYGAMAGASDELRKCIAQYGVRHDKDWPDLPEFDPRDAPLTPEAVRLMQELQVVVEQLLETLPPREAKVLRLRFGIGLREDYTLEAIGNMFDVQRERVRQIEAKALRRLKYRRQEEWQLAGFIEKGNR